ncbi:hypothetical protein M5K25_026203 [Dendrobium thyrsiflorum]|uniref:Uncharacterized protein n=1 Tax=Dendrobium thyrsiflorum TaxID=117978 RepID=A0ABD0TWP2_DENTH
MDICGDSLLFCSSSLVFRIRRITASRDRDTKQQECHLRDTWETVEKEDKARASSLGVRRAFSLDETPLPFAGSPFGTPAAERLHLSCSRFSPRQNPPHLKRTATELQVGRSSPDKPYRSRARRRLVQPVLVTPLHPTLASSGSFVSGRPEPSPTSAPCYLVRSASFISFQLVACPRTEILSSHLEFATPGAGRAFFTPFVDYSSYSLLLFLQPDHPLPQPKSHVLLQGYKRAEPFAQLSRLFGPGKSPSDKNGLLAEALVLRKPSCAFSMTTSDGALRIPNGVSPVSTEPQTLALSRSLAPTTTASTDETLGEFMISLLFHRHVFIVFMEVSLIFLDIGYVNITHILFKLLFELTKSEDDASRGLRLSSYGFSFVMRSAIDGSTILLIWTLITVIALLESFSSLSSLVVRESCMDHSIEEDDSLLEDVRIEHRRLVVDFMGEGVPPVVLTLVVESLVGVEGTHFEILPSFGYALLGKVLKFLLQQRVAPRDKRRLTLGVRDSWTDSWIGGCWNERLPKCDCCAF